MHSLNQSFAALSDPTRRGILQRLRNGPATVTQLAEPYALTQQAISKHLLMLERAQLIEKRREGRQHFCSLRPAALKQAADWIEQYRRDWEDAFGRLDVLLMDLQQQQQETRHVRRKS